MLQDALRLWLSGRFVATPDTVTTQVLEIHQEPLCERIHHDL